MNNITKYTLKLLSSRQKLHLSLILFFSIIVSFSELIGLGSVALFVTLIADPNFIITKIPFKNLSYFIKCTGLCSQIEMYLENNLPLVVKYNVASLGEIKLCLAPLPSTQ